MPKSTLEDVLALAEKLSPAEKARLIARLADELAASTQSAGGHSFLGLAADLGPAPSPEDIAEVRSEMLRDL